MLPTDFLQACGADTKGLASLLDRQVKKARQDLHADVVLALWLSNQRGEGNLPKAIIQLYR